MPWSWAAGTKCVRPGRWWRRRRSRTMPASSQNGLVRAGVDAAPAAPGGAAPVCAARRLRVGLGRRRTAAGPRPAGGRAAAAARAGRPRARQPADDHRGAAASRARSISQDSSGRKTSCPAAPAAVRMPVTRPRRATNQRLVTVRGEGQRHRPAAEADQDAPAQHQLPGSRHEDGQHRCRARSCSSAQATTRADAEAVHQRGGEGRGQPVQRDVDRDGGADHAARPAELRVQRVDQQRRGGTGSRPRRAGSRR